MNDKVFIPFEINESTDTPFTEMDPDTQFYSSTHYALNTRYDNFIEDTFLTNMAGKNQYKNKLSLFHINVKNLPKHYDELELYINSLKFKFSGIALTENWLMNQNKTCLTYEASTVCINFVKEREEVVFPCIFKMGLI